MTRAKTAQMKMEHYYKVAVDSAIERNTRYARIDDVFYTRDLTSHLRRVELERRLQAESTMPEERKNRQLLQLGKRESTYLRLKRTKLGVDDFRTVKVIGKGAFGEVRRSSDLSMAHLTLAPRFDWYKKSTPEKYTP